MPTAQPWGPGSRPAVPTQLMPQYKVFQGSSVLPPSQLSLFLLDTFHPDLQCTVSHLLLVKSGNETC